MTVQFSKRMKAMSAKAPGKKPVSVPEAVSILKEFEAVFRKTKAKAKPWDQTVEIAVRLGIDPKQADQAVRGAIVLPHGIGKALRVVVFAKGDKIDEAKSAGADEIGGPELAEKIKGGWTDFDVCIAAPDMMGVVGPLGKVLGPRGLMPSPRAGTVTPDLAKVIKEYKAGKVEFRNDATGILHAVVGKLSFDAQKLAENITAFINHVQALKPAAVKGQYIKSIAVSATMSPSVRIQAA